MKGIAIIIENKETFVYNLHTNHSTHNYFANNILVHNCDAISRILDDNLGATFPKMKEIYREDAKNNPDSKYDIYSGNTAGSKII